MADGQGSSRSPASPNGGGSHESGGDQSPRSNVREQDRFLPIANISRIMKKALPANGKIAKDAKETVQECVSEFISFITSEASDKCQKEKRKTINGDDLLWAMATLGFEDYIEPLKVYLARYREMEVSECLIQCLYSHFHFLPFFCFALGATDSFGRVIQRDLPRLLMGLLKEKGCNLVLVHSLHIKVHSRKE
ncbi:nuclear transcription factor Y subunit B-1 isoform X1 [Nicotiana tabacum]|uniref:Nuclear transcription factor Y subunit B-1 isoform X1 n=1 Tax=Nicotiana tabacum TaxID=4097 RepID=A0A1S4DBI7_TOBAC|nr:PREDICTED: nuclear transcription factor Y subunit B-10-like isoform X1 [Nicotiana tabacum]